MSPHPPSELDTKLTVAALLVVALIVYLTDSGAREMARDLETQTRLRIDAEQKLDAALSEWGAKNHGEQPAGQ